MAVGVPFSVELKSERVGEECEVILHRITLADSKEGGGSWVEEFGSDEQAKAFLRGVQAGTSMLGQFISDVPVVPDRNWV